MLNELFTRYPQLSECADTLKTAAAALVNCYRNGGKLLLCGNGGSHADCDHIVGELMKGFLKKTPVEQHAKRDNKALRACFERRNAGQASKWFACHFPTVYRCP